MAEDRREQELRAAAKSACRGTETTSTGSDSSRTITGGPESTATESSSSRRQLRQLPHDHRWGRKCSHREQRSKRQLRQQILTVVERLCPGSRYSRCGRQIHLRKNPCHRQSRSNISWNKKSQILWMQNPLRISSLSVRIRCRKRPRRKKVVPFLCKEKQRQRDRCSHKSTDTTGK